MLSLQSKRAPVRIHLATLALDGAVEEVAGIELHTRLRGEQLQDATGLRVTHLSRNFADITLGIQRPVEIKPTLFRLSEFQLRMIRLDVRADRGWFAEVHRRAGHGCQFAGRDQFGGDRGVIAGVQGGDLFEDVAIAGAGEVEVAVVGQVEHGRFVGAGLVVDAQLVVVGEAIGHFGGEVAGEAHFTVRRQIGQGHAD